MALRHWKIFVGGGGDDWFTEIVKDYSEEYSKLNPDYVVEYYSWTDSRALSERLKRIYEDTTITVVGHSYGGDTAFHCIPNRFVNTLISIDPVGRFQAGWASIRPHCGVWLNVRAEPSKDRRTFDETIAWAGRKYPRPPAQGQPNAPNYSLIANATHGDFRRMMRGSAAGISGRMLLGGASVA